MTFQGLYAPCLWCTYNVNQTKQLHKRWHLTNVLFMYIGVVHVFCAKFRYCELV